MMYIITHKEFQIPSNLKQFQVLQVGAENNEDLGYLKDNQGDNISKWNSYFCELTGMYWIWKNSDEKYVGLCHYRRYFAKQNKIMEISELNRLLEGYDMITPRVVKFATSVYRQYGYSDQHNLEDFDCMVNVIKEKCPEYVADLEKVMKENYFYPFNMMYLKKELYDEYCEWLFGILFELEKRIPYTTYKGQKKRVFGFLSERLLLVWIKRNKCKTREIKVLNTEIREGISEKIFRRMNTYSTLYLGIDFRKRK